MASEAEVHEEIVRRCREDIVRQVWAHYRVREKEQFAGSGHVPPGAKSFGKVTDASRDELRDGGWQVASPRVSETLKVSEEMPDMRDLLLRLEAAVDQWAEEVLGRPLTDAEREVWGSAGD